MCLLSPAENPMESNIPSPLSVYQEKISMPDLALPPLLAGKKCLLCRVWITEGCGTEQDLEVKASLSIWAASLCSIASALGITSDSWQGKTPKVFGIPWGFSNVSCSVDVIVKKCWGEVRVSSACLLSCLFWDGCAGSCCEISLRTSFLPLTGQHPGVCAQIPSPLLLCLAPGLCLRAVGWLRPGEPSPVCTALLHLQLRQVAAPEQSPAGERQWGWSKGDAAVGMEQGMQQGTLLTAMVSLAPAQGTAQLWVRCTQAAPLGWCFSCSIPCYCKRSVTGLRFLLLLFSSLLFP